jgi:hypothetical protein
MVVPRGKTTSRGFRWASSGPVAGHSKLRSRSKTIASVPELAHEQRAAGERQRLNYVIDPRLDARKSLIWRGWRGSNPRPSASEADTLSTELQPRGWKRPILVLLRASRMTTAFGGQYSIH